MSKFLILPEADGTRTAVLAADIYGVMEAKVSHLNLVGNVLHAVKPENKCTVLVAGHEYPIPTTLDLDTIVAAAEIAKEDEEFEEEEDAGYDE